MLGKIPTRATAIFSWDRGDAGFLPETNLRGVGIKQILNIEKQILSKKSF
jgi:hypothetical protein